MSMFHMERRSTNTLIIIIIIIINSSIPIASTDFNNKPTIFVWQSVGHQLQVSLVVGWSDQLRKI